jgi:hypothetical protein
LSQCVNNYWVWVSDAGGAGGCGDNSEFMKDQVENGYIPLFAKPPPARGYYSDMTVTDGISLIVLYCIVLNI